MKAAKCRSYIDKIVGHRQPVLAMLSPTGPNGHRLYSASADGWLYVWDIPNKDIQHKAQLLLPENNKPIQFACIELSENTVYGGLTTGQIYSWNIKSGEIVGCYDFHQRKISYLKKICPRVLASVESGGSEVLLWDTLSVRLEHRLVLDHEITKVALDGERLFVLAERHYLYVFNTEGRLQQSFEQLDHSKYYVNIFTTEHYVCLTTDSGEVEIASIPYKKGSSRPLINLQGAWASAVKEYSVSGNSQRRIILGCSDGSIRLVQITAKPGSKSGECVLTEVSKVEAHNTWINCLQLCSGLLFSGSSDYSIKSWSLEDMCRQQRQRRLMHRQQLQSMKYQTYLKCKKKKKKSKRPKSRLTK